MSTPKEKQVYLREYRRGREIIVAICDQDTLGNVYKENRLILDVTPRFYGGDLVDVPYAIAQIKRASIANLVGNIIVNAAIKADLIHPEAIHHVQGIAHAQRMTI